MTPWNQPTRAPRRRVAPAGIAAAVLVASTAVVLAVVLQATDEAIRSVTEPDTGAPRRSSVAPGDRSSPESARTRRSRPHARSRRGAAIAPGEIPMAPRPPAPNAPRVSGRVILDFGERIPLRGVPVSLRMIEDGTREALYRTRTRHDGTYEFRLWGATHGTLSSVWAEAADGRRFVPAEIPRVAETITLADIVIPGSATRGFTSARALRIRVHGPNRDPVESAQVVVIRGRSPETPATAVIRTVHGPGATYRHEREWRGAPEVLRVRERRPRAEAGGVFEVADRDWTAVEIRAAGLAAVRFTPESMKRSQIWAKWNPMANGDMQVDVQLPRRLFGRVVNAQGFPRPGVTLRAVAAGFEETVVTDGSGKFEFETVGAASGLRVLAVAHGDEFALAVQSPADGGARRVIWPDDGWLALDVEEVAHGTPLRWALKFSRLADRPYRVVESRAGTARMIRVVAGFYDEVWVAAKGYAPDGPTSVRIASGTTERARIVPVDKAVTVQWRLSPDELTAGVRSHIADRSGRIPSVLWPEPTIARNGTHRVTGLPASDLLLVVQDRVWFRQEIPVDAWDGADIDLGALDVTVPAPFGTDVDD